MIFTSKRLTNVGDCQLPEYKNIEVNKPEQIGLQITYYNKSLETPEDNNKSSWAHVKDLIRNAILILIEIISMHIHANAAISNKNAYTYKGIVKHGEKIIEQMGDLIGEENF